MVGIREQTSMRSFVALLIAVLALSIAAPQVQALKRTIVGTSSGWMPLEKLAGQVGMGDEYVDQIINSNLTLYCPFTKKDGKVVQIPVNAWVLNEDVEHIYTNAHAILLKKEKLREDVADCTVETARDQMFTNPRRTFRLETDPASISMGLPIDDAGNVLTKLTPPQ